MKDSPQTDTVMFGLDPDIFCEKDYRVAPDNDGFAMPRAVKSRKR